VWNSDLNCLVERMNRLLDENVILTAQTNLLVDESCSLLEKWTERKSDHCRLGYRGIFGGVSRRAIALSL
jgi:hypothetical protein